MKNILSKSLPHLVAILAFLIIAFVYFQPALDGKQLRKGDTIQALGYKKEITDFRNKTGNETLWTNSMFGGMPAYQISVKYKARAMRFVRDIMELETPKPIRYLMLYLIGFYILMIALRVNPWLAIGGSIAYAFSTYMIIIIGAGHIWKVHALAYIPPALAGILLTFRGKYWLGGLLSALFLIMELYSNHIQMTYYFLLATICITIFEFYYRYQQKELKQFFTAVGVLAVAAILAIGVNISNLYHTYDYGTQTVRGKSELTLGNKTDKTSGLDKSYATQWSYGIQETLSLLIPNVKGGAGAPQEAMQLLNYISNQQLPSVKKYYEMEQMNNHHYWGNQPFTAGPVYAGAAILFLFFLGLFVVRGRLKWGLLTAIILSTLLAWGHNFQAFTDFFLHYIPLYNKFRVVSSILVIVELCIPILGILAVKKIIEKPEILQQKIDIKFAKVNVLILPAILTAGVALVLYLLPQLFLDFLSKAEMQYFTQIKSANANAVDFINTIQADIVNARIAIFKADALRTIIFVMLTIGLFIALNKKIINKTMLIVGVVALILIDLWPINKRFVNNANFVPKKELKVAFTPSNADFQILQQEMANHPKWQAEAVKAQQNYKKEHRRASKLELAIIPFEILNSHTNYRVLNTTVSPFKDGSTSYFHKSIGGYHGAKLRRYQELIDYHISKNNRSVLNMLNTKYIIVPDKEKGAIAQQNPGALGVAWIVDQYKIVPNADAELLALKDFDPAKTAIIDKRFSSDLKGFTATPDSLATITMQRYAPNHISYKFKANSKQMVVFSDIYYQPGWQAYIDGKKVAHFRADYVLRAMLVPAGTHKIDFKFEPQAFKVTETISVISMLLFLVLGIFAVFIMVKNRNNTSRTITVND